MFVVIPQMIVSVGIGFVLEIFDDNKAVGLAVGGGAAFIGVKNKIKFSLSKTLSAAFSVLFLIIREKSALPLAVPISSH